MEKPIQHTHSIFPSLQELLAPRELSKLLGRSVTRVDCQVMNGHSGLAGGQLYYVNTDVGRFVLKKMSIASDWIMFSSNDKSCRSVKLWQYGLLDRLRPHLEHKILACARDGASWAILMEDLSGHVYSWDHLMPRETVCIFLDGLAFMHAMFWNDSEISNPEIGLCDTAQLLNQTSLPMALKYQGTSMGVIPVWVTGGWEVMEEIVDPEVFNWMYQLTFDPQLLINVLDHYSTTLLHGDFRAENLAYQGQPVSLDWQEATQGLMTIDLAWFTKSLNANNGIEPGEAVSFYRQKLETYLKKQFDNQEWQKMVDLGNLIDALRSTCFAAFWYKHAEDQQNREERLSLVRSHSLKVENAMSWLAGKMRGDSFV